MKILKTALLCATALTAGLTFAGCSSESKNGNIISVDIEPLLNEGENVVRNYMADIKLVKLETNADTYFDWAGAIKTIDDRIIILSRSSILIFDTDGHHIASTLHGNGPEEMANIESMYVDRQQKQIMAACEKGILYFDLDGNYIKTRTFEKKPFLHQFIKYGDRFFITSFMEHEGAVHRYFVTDTAFNVLSAYGINRDKMVRQMGGGFTKTGDRIFLTVFASDTIMIYDGNRMTPYMVLDYKEKSHGIVFKENVELTVENIRNMYEPGYLVSPAYYETGNTQYISLENGRDEKRFSALRNGKSGKITGNIYDRTGIDKFLQTDEDNMFVKVADSDNAEDIIRVLGDKLTSEQIADLQQTADNDNIALLFFTVNY